MAMSVVNRVRFTAWAWLASAFLVGLATGVVVAGVPLWNRLQAANSEVARLTQVEQLTRLVAPGADAETLVSLEEPPRIAGSSALSAESGALKHNPAEPSPILAHEMRSPQVAKVNAPTPEVELRAPQAERAVAPEVHPPHAPSAMPSRPSESERKAAEAKKAAQAVEEAERKAKAERQAKADREQRLAKAAQEAKQKLEREREQAEARAAAAVAAARAKPTPEAPPRAEQVVRLAPPVPAAGTNAPTERVTKDEAGVADIQASGVTFKSGRRVAVGDSFPSGEKLVSVDPAIGEIITSKRRIVIKASAPAVPHQ